MALRSASLTQAPSGPGRRTDCGAVSGRRCPGRRRARALADRRVLLEAADCPVDELDRAADELGEHATALRSDVADLADLDRLFAAIEARETGLDVLFANAGGGAFTCLEELTPEQFDSTFSINVRGTVFTVQQALPLLNPGASVIVTGSTSASRGVPAFGVYSASKAAIYQFARVWAAELAGRGIRVNTVVPGPTETPGLVGLAAPSEGRALIDAEAALLPLSRVGRPEEIANGVLFLASDQSSFMTGSQLFIDGGDVQTYAT